MEPAENSNGDNEPNFKATVDDADRALLRAVALLVFLMVVWSGTLSSVIIQVTHLFDPNLPSKIAIGSVVFSTLIVWAGFSHWKLPRYVKFTSSLWLIRAGCVGWCWIMAERATTSMYTVQSQDGFIQSYYDYEFTHSLFIVGSAMIMAILAMHLVEDKPVPSSETDGSDQFIEVK